MKIRNKTKQIQRHKIYTIPLQSSKQAKLSCTCKHKMELVCRLILWYYHFHAIKRVKIKNCTMPNAIPIFSPFPISCNASLHFPKQSLFSGVEVLGKSSSNTRLSKFNHIDSSWRYDQIELFQWNGSFGEFKLRQIFIKENFTGSEINLG